MRRRQHHPATLAAALAAPAVLIAACSVQAVDAEPASGAAAVVSDADAEAPEAGTEVLGETAVDETPLAQPMAARGADGADPGGSDVTERHDRDPF